MTTTKKTDTTTAERPAELPLADPPPESQALTRPGAQPPAPRLQSMHDKGAIMRGALQGLIPTSIGEAGELAQRLARSGVVPKSLKGNADSIFTIILAGLELGLTPIRALQSLQAIHGNLGMKADLQLALAYNSGTVEYFDEGYEEHGTTDTGLEQRGVRDAMKILALVKDLPQGKPYGWASCHRKGRQLVTRVFSFADAERAFTYEGDEDGGGEKTKKKLSEKFNYKSWPMDMYPRRARVRVLAITHADVLLGLPSTEALEDKLVVEGEVIDETDAPDTDQLMMELDALNHDQAVAIAAGFDQLKIAGAGKLAKLMAHRGKPDQLLAWLKDEYARRKTGSPKARPDVLGVDAGKTTTYVDTAKPPASTQPTPPVVPAATAANPPAEAPAPKKRASRAKPSPATAEPIPAGADTKPADPEPIKPPADPKPADPEPAPTAKSLADKFKGSLDSF